MGLRNANLLLTINFIHFLASGVVVPFLSKHIAQHGGNQVIIGTLQSVVYLCQKFSKDFFAMFNYSRRFTLIISLYCSFFDFFILVFFTYWWLVFLVRMHNAITSQVLPYTKEFIAMTETSQIKIKFLNLVDAVRVAGLSFGAVIGGCLMYNYKNMKLNASFGSLLSFICLVLIHQLDSYGKELDTTESRMFLLPSEFFHRIENLRTVNLRPQMTKVLLKASFTCSFAIYFARFGYFLNYNYKINTLKAGFTRAFSYVISFMMSFIVPFVKQQSTDKKALLEYSLMVCSFSLVGLYFAPSFDCYLFIYLPMMFTYVLSNALMEGDALKLKADKNIARASDTIGTLISIITPVTIATMTQFFSARVCRIAALMPVIFCMYLLNKWLLSSEDEESDVNTDDEEDFALDVEEEEQRQ